MSMLKNKTKNIVISALFIAFGVITLYISSVFPPVRMTMLLLSGFVIAISTFETTIIYGIISFLSTTIISILIVPNKMVLIPYVLLFGSYSLIKNILDKNINNKKINWLIKIVLFTVISIINSIFVKFIFLKMNNVGYIVAIIIFSLCIFYDFLLKWIELWYINNFKSKRIKIKLGD